MFAFTFIRRHPIRADVARGESPIVAVVTIRAPVVPPAPRGFALANVAPIPAFRAAA